MAAAAGPPPLPQLPIEVLNEGNYRTVQRYGVIYHPYIRYVLSGPFVITRIDANPGGGGRLFHIIEDFKLFDQHNNPIPIADLEEGTDERMASELTAWTPDTQLGKSDPLYPIIEAPEGKFRPGVRVIGKLNYPWMPDEPMKVIKGPFRGRNRQGHPTIFYICKSENPKITYSVVKEENELRENPVNLEARMKISSELHRQANRLPILKNIISEKLSTIRVPRVVEAASGAASVGQASVSPFFGARGTARGTVENIKQYPENIMRRIANFAYGSNEYTNATRQAAELYGGPIAYGLPLKRRGGTLKRRSKKRRTQRHRRLN